jgi:DNA polymerase elongation subunit (family B)
MNPCDRQPSTGNKALAFRGFLLFLGFMNFETNAALFGHNPQPGIVAVDFDGARTALVFVRDDSGATRVESHAFDPYLWTAAPHGQPPAGVRLLDGPHPLNALRTFEDWAGFQAARAAKDAPVFALGDPVQQFLTATGRTLFKGMTFDALRRLQIHLAPDAIELGDAGGWVESLPFGSVEEERAALERLQAVIEERDPDVIEGHQLFKTILPRLAGRAKAFKLRLRWGRDGSPVAARASRLQIAEKTIQYTRFAARGRHFVDTFLLAQYYDVGTRELEAFDLETVATHFRLAERSGAAATRALAATLSASYFTQAQIFPFNYQDVIVRGNATKIDALFLREYLRRAHSLPELPEPRPFEGGYTDIFFTGVARDVWHCDVASLYPSVMLRFDMLPENDTLGVFRGLLGDLRSFRLEAKRAMRAAESAPLNAPTLQAQRHFGALQNTFKILINSFYGYLGFAQGHFADFNAASAVTAKGRELLRAMVDWLRGRGANVIEIDTDGIYFQPPPGASPSALETGLRAVLPEGIEVEFDAQYAAMFSYKAKNYALLAQDGRVTLTGAALKSRGMEPYLRDFLLGMVRCLLAGDPAGVHALRAECEGGIRSGTWPIERLARTETLQDSLASYQKKIAASSRNRSAAFELALASGRDATEAGPCRPAYQAGDAVTYYVTGTKKKVVAYEAARRIEDWNPQQRDENVEYYVAKLNELAGKFAEFAPKPDPQGSLGL